MLPAKATAALSPPLLILFLAAAAVAAAAGGRDADRSALLRFKDSVSDPGGLLSGWSGSGDHCGWPGVACDRASSRVVSLNVSSTHGRKLAGELVPALGDLAELVSLALPAHGFTGHIPRGIWAMEKLRALDLSGNLLSGTLPSPSSAALRSLKLLNLARNSLSGGIPSSFSSAASLESLNLSGNRLNGTIPAFLFELPSLSVLFLSSNKLSGSIPTVVGSRCAALQRLDLSRNLLVGPIPPSLGNCTNLQSLLLFSNLLDNIIPPELGKLAKLRVLDISRNCISGSIPDELGNCVELAVLVLSNPNDPALVPEETGQGDTNDFNYLQGGIPQNVTSLPKLRILWAPRAVLEGEIPSNWGRCENLEMVNLASNLFTGELPKAFVQCNNLKFLNLSSNKLTGWLPEDLPVPCMDVFDVSGNKLSGTLPRFTAGLCNSSSLPRDDISSGYSLFLLQRARLEMWLPFYEPRHEFVVYHSISFNNFTGPLPPLPVVADRFGKQVVYAFLADGNNLGGNLENILSGKCNSLKALVLILDNNRISGAISPNTSNLCNSLAVLSASGNQITGAIPEDFGFLDALVALDLSRNRINSEIPASLPKLKVLEFLYLANNNLSGKIPAGLTQLTSLKVLDLSSNSFYGEIPGDIANLKNLSVLHLEKNNLSGRIPPGLASFSTISIFNASYNNLSGPFPSNVSQVVCDGVIGNPLLPPCPMYALSIPPSNSSSHSWNYQNQIYADPPLGSSTSKSSSSGFNSIEIASITSAAAIVSVLIALIILYVYTRKCAPRQSVQSSGRKEVTFFVDVGVPITYESVVRATGSFNASNCIGSGGFGATYKAEISPGLLVAIKRLSIGRFQGVQQFHAEIKTLGRWRHPNLVTLIGYHVSETEMFLIYNYLPGGNLERFIQERSKRPIDWRMLHKIALDVARALAYLHDHCVPRILHRDVKPSNILLDNDYTAHLSDFGLARLLGNSETHATTGVAGTFGYVAPEYAMTCRVSDKADVYSYGVVLLELLSDKKALDPSFSPYGNGFNIVAWACMLLKQGRAREFFTEGLWDVGPHDDLVETLHLAVMCTVETLSIRPTMKQVVQRLKQLRPPNC